MDDKVKIMTNADLTYMHLPSGMIIRNYIDGWPPYSYEDYLLDFVNSSSYFSKKAHSQEYHHPKSESNKECDCISESYQLDFKLLDTYSKLEQNSQFSNHIYSNGALTIYSEPSRTASRPAYPLSVFYALRTYNCDDFSNIGAKDDISPNEKRDLISLTRPIRKEKNLLLFLPFNLYFENNEDENLGLQFILDALNNDFKSLFQFRSKIVPNKDTYLSFIYAQKFIITQWNDDTFSYIDAVSITSSPLFMDLINTTIGIFSGSGLQ